MEKGIAFFTVSIVIIPIRVLCQMQANSSGAEFLSTISKFMKRLLFSSVVVQLTAKKCTKKCNARAKLLFLTCQAIAQYLTFSSPPHLLLPVIYDIYIVMSQKQNILGAN